LADKKITAKQTLIGIIPLLLLLFLLTWIESRWEQVLHVSGIYLLFASVTGTLPVLYFLYRSIQRDLRRKQADYSPLLTWMVFIAGSPMMIFSCGYVLVLVLNAVLSPQAQIIYEGHVLAKKEVKGRSTHYYLTLDNVDDYGLELRIEVSRHQYGYYNIGDRFRQKMHRGGLGIDYRLRW